MAALTAGLLWAALLAWLLRRTLRQARAHASLPSPQAADAALPSVAVILPVRNECANIADCLERLLSQGAFPGGVPIVVVDDDSHDGTAEVAAQIALRHPQIALRRLRELPQGWLGKPHACWCGAQGIEAEFLCFIDADVRVAPPLLASALAAARHLDIDMLSLAPFQVLGTFWERLIVPAALVLIGCVIDLRRVDDPSADDIAVNGQILLVRRSVYLAVGGHAAVREEICEDKALATRVKQGGWRYRLLDGRSLAHTRMYTDLRSLWWGFAKNAVEIIGNPSHTLAVATAALLIGWAALLLPLLTGIGAIATPTPATIAGFALALGGSLLILAVQLGTARHLRIPLAFGLLFPLAYTAVALLALTSVVVRRTGRVRWKGRVCGVAAPAAASSAASEAGKRGAAAR